MYISIQARINSISPLVVCSSLDLISIPKSSNINNMADLLLSCGSGPTYNYLFPTVTMLIIIIFPLSKIMYSLQI